MMVNQILHICIRPACQDRNFGIGGPRAPAAQRRDETPAAQEAFIKRTTEVQDGETTESLVEFMERAKREAAAKRRRRKQADSTDWVSTQLTRRFGIAGGLAWLGVLTFGVVSEQVKTRLENAAEESNTKMVDEVREVARGDGLRYKDLKIGGGTPVQRGFLTVLHFRGTADGSVFEDTRARGKPIVFFYGARPFTGGLCLGVEEALSDMRAGGVREVLVPPELGFGAEGLSLRGTEHVPGKSGTVPPNAVLSYTLELIRVSIPPS